MDHTAAASGTGRNPLYLRMRKLQLRWYRFSDPLLGNFRRRWQHSLSLRTITMIVLATMVMTTITGGVIISSVGENLVQSRVQAALNDSARTTVSAQQQIDRAEVSDRGSFSNLMLAVRGTIRDTSSSQLIYVRRAPGQQQSLEAPLDFVTGPGVQETVSPALSDKLNSGSHPQVWQYSEITNPNFSDTTTPGMIVGTSLNFPSGVGTYNLFIYYSFDETENSLQLISRILIATGFVLLIFIAFTAWFATARIAQPVRHTARVSRELADGNLAARMSHQNDSHFDELADNFNEMADILKARIDELDHLSTMQQRFVSDVSHELRTPLTTIKLASDVLTASSDPESQQRAAKVLSDQIDRFEGLLGDLLEISRYDAGRIQLETEPTNIVDLTHNIVAQLQPLSRSVIEVRPLGGYTSLDVDPRRIRRILSNLIGNAIEHGEGRPIVVTIDSNSTALAVTVRDHGIGMTKEQTQRVFDRFWRADPARKRTLGGTGLGLAIAQEDAAVHGGRIEVWSEPQQGSNFRLTLPRREQDDSFLSPLPLQPEEQAGDTLTTGWVDRPRRWLLRKGR